MEQVGVLKLVFQGFISDDIRSHHLMMPYQMTTSGDIRSHHLTTSDDISEIELCISYFVYILSMYLPPNKQHTINTSLRITTLSTQLFLQLCLNLPLKSSICKTVEVANNNFPTKERYLKASKAFEVSLEMSKP